MRLPALRLPTFGPAHMVLAVAALLLGLFVYAAAQTATQTYRLHDERRTLAQQVEVLRKQKAELEGLREYLASDEYVESVARSQFGLVRPGETAVVVDSPAEPAPTRTPGERWWESLFSR
ncbi:MAG: septum formation initiator family protein [Dehalococcoidia bacterium]|nr:septum formation initiator family protein [Dehalococcoidia bacterium]HRC62872.1 septum formation initiator family protein [Dehalococcoidia bacterium]